MSFSWLGMIVGLGRTKAVAVTFVTVDKIYLGAETRHDQFSSVYAKAGREVSPLRGSRPLGQV